MDGWVGAARIPERKMYDSYCMSLGCDELMGWYDMGWMEGRVGMIWYGMVWYSR
jgi:hypothetical protein